MVTLALLTLGAIAVNPSWQMLPPIPDREGFAGSFAGTSGGAMIVAGGANFPDKKPWEGGTKVWTEAIFVLERPTGSWQRAGNLPRTLGYGACATHRDTVVCVGGGNARGHYADAFRLRWSQGQLSIDALPSLPKPLANLAGAIVGDTFFAIGGLERSDGTSCEATVFSLDLSDPKAIWRSRERIPGTGRMFPMVAAHADRLWCAGGVALKAGPEGKPVREYLKDAYRYDSRGWTRIADLPQPLAAAPNFADARGFTIIGGDDGSQVATQPDRHVGFSNLVFRFESNQAKWLEIGTHPAPRVTAPLVNWMQRLVIPGGEVRPGVRSPEVWTGVVPNAKRP